MSKRNFFCFMLSFLCCFLFLTFSPKVSAQVLSGIDVSVWEGSIDFEAVQDSGIDVVYIRAAEGSSYVDPYFISHYNGALNAGLKIGFYHYITATNTQEAQEQAKFFASLIKDKHMDCIPVMDFESFSSLSNWEINQIALTYLQTLESLLNIEPMVYSDASNAANLWDNALTNYPLWVANYGVSSPSSIGQWQSWAGFQYSDTGSVNGISGNVDLDYFKDTIFITPSHHTFSPSTSHSSSSTSHTSSSNNFFTYTVQAGNTLSGIADEFNTTVNTLVTLNNIQNPNLIYIGQNLLIPTTSSSSTPSSPTTSHSSTFTYIVQSGDTLSGIAVYYGTTVHTLVALNNISNPNLIYIGETLRIPQNNYSSSASSYFTYIVQSGDTLSEIALSYDTTVATLVRMNHISNPNMIYVGQTLLIPNN